MNPAIRIGTAGWTIPPQLKAAFEGPGTHLQRYATAFGCVEINSSFYRDHKPETYEKWAESTPDDFRFSVKLSRYFTQETRLGATGARLFETLRGIGHLGPKFGALLVQLPPSLDFRRDVAERFIGDLRAMHAGPLFWEPRHRSWGRDDAIDLLARFGINKVMADPEPCPIEKSRRAVLERERYFRLHGSPLIYKSRYPEDVIARLSSLLREPAGRPAWVIFDNTTYGYATENAMELQRSVET